MRRFLSTTAVTAGLLLATALPALAADAANETAKGTFGGLGLAAIFGVAFGIVLTVLAYRDKRFGTDPAHHEQAHDHRDGYTDHNVGQDQLADLEGQNIEPPAGTP